MRDLALFLGTVVVGAATMGYLLSCVLVALSRRALPRATVEETTAFRRGLYAVQRRNGLCVLALVAAWVAVLVAAHLWRP